VVGGLHRQILSAQMGDLQRKTDPARRVVRAIARLVFAVIYFRLTKCQSLFAGLIHVPPRGPFGRKKQTELPLI